jgi:hypothetical protein
VHGGPSHEDYLICSSKSTILSLVYMEEDSFPLGNSLLVLIIMVFCYWPSYVFLSDAYNNRPFCMVEKLTCRNDIDP